MKRQVKIFRNCLLCNLESDMNEFLKTIDAEQIVEIKINPDTVMDNYGRFWMVGIIIYNHIPSYVKETSARIDTLYMED